MASFRAFIGNHRHLALWLAAVALAMKALVPAGYMVGQQGNVLTVHICADAQAQHLTKQIVIPQKGGSSQDGSEHGKASGTCPHSSLTKISLSGANATLLAVALIFILALGFADLALPALARLTHIRPPLRGPPAHA
jgi:hypothetical protein